MYYLLDEKCNLGFKIITEENYYIQRHLQESDVGWDADRLIKWMFGYKNKSENLFELIEVGDLIAFNYNNNSIDIVSVRFVDKNLEGTINILSRGYSHELDKIVAIYKPNSKGNYIKVWERDLK